MTDPGAPSDAFLATRRHLHAVAEHVLAAARYQSTGRIGLAARPGGLTTAPFGDPPREIAVDGVELVVRTGAGAAAQETRAPLTTLGDAARFAGMRLGGPAEVYALSTPCEPDAPLALDPDAVRRLAEWYALGDAALREWRQEIAEDDPSSITLWPEHLDVALRAGEVNYGASPGDEYVPGPYLYVGPPLPVAPADDGFWNASFGAVLTEDKVRSVADAVDFFRAGRRHARG